MSTGQITREQLHDALTRKKISTEKRDKLLIEPGNLKPDQTQRCLITQQTLVTVAVIAALSLPHTLTTGKAQATPAVSANITVTATVLERATMQVLKQPPDLVITTEDIRRGYVDAHAASRIMVKTNNSGGCLLAFEAVTSPASLFNSVLVMMNGREVQISGNGWIPQPFIKGGFTQDISYRFALSANALPGRYPWPLSISVLPLAK